MSFTARTSGGRAQTTESLPWSRTLLATAIVLLFGAAVQLVLERQYRDDPFAATYVSDALSYDHWASRIAAAGLGGEPVFHQSPLYPALLGSIYGAVEAALRPSAVRLTQGLMYALALALLVPLGRLYLRSTAAGVAAAAMALLYAPFAFHALKLLPVTLALVSQATGLLALAAARRSGRPVAAALAGVAWAVACLARSEMLLFAPLAVAAIWRPRRALPAAFLLGLLVGLAPATIHNVRQGDFVVIASGGGENLFVGNQRGADGGHTALHSRAGDIFSQRALATRLAEQARGRTLRPSEVSSYWRGRALSEIVAAPGRWVLLESRKLWRLVHPGDPADMYSLPLERARYLPLLHLLPLPTWPLLLLGGTGLYLGLRLHRGASWPLAALIVVHVAVLLIFFVSTRLRLPLYFLLTPFAGLAVIEGLRRWRARTDRAAVAAIGILLIAGAGVSLRATRPAAREVVRLASVLSTQDRPDEALDLLAPLVSGPRPDALALDQAGWIRHKRGDLAAARPLYRRALDAGMPAAREPQTRTRLATVLERLEVVDRAASEHDAAVTSPHVSAGTYFERGMFRLRRGNTEGAIEDLRAARDLDPGWPPPRAALKGLGISD